MKSAKRKETNRMKLFAIRSALLAAVLTFASQLWARGVRRRTRLGGIRSF